MSIGFLHTQLFLFNKPEPMRQSTLLMALATSIGDSQALMASLRALIADSSGTWQGKLKQLTFLLHDGASLTEACSAVQGIVPEKTRIAIRVAEPAGALKQILADEAHELMQQGISDASKPKVVRVFFKLMILCLITQWILSFIMIFVIPKFRDIFDGFGVQLPASTQLLINLSDWVLNFWIVIFLPLATFALYMVVMSIWGRWRYLTSGHRPLVQHWPRFWTPEILRGLSASMTAGRPIPEAIHAFLAEMPPGRSATKLSAVRSSAENGMDFWLALKKHGFVTRSERAVLRAAQEAGNLDWATIQLARQIHDRRSRRLTLVASILQPLAVLTIGIGIAFIILALYLPVIKLMNDLS